MKHRAQTLLALSTGAAIAALSFATPASAWHINSTCSNSQWIVGIPNESWANGTTATLDFNQGQDSTLGKGQATTAPAAATSVTVSFNNSGERLSASRPEGCVVVVQAIPTTTTVDPTTTTAAPVITAVASSSLAVVTLDIPPPAALVAVDVPPVPQPQGVSAAGGQTLPVTGAGDDLLTWGAAMVLAAGLVMVLVARRRVA